ncbi:MAG: hypothetical protein HY231_08620 [Acidobacteria bacterium]|nr:hypothetical protein [Acidobacteriota bacterium]
MKTRIAKTVCSILLAFTMFCGLLLCSTSNLFANSKTRYQEIATAATSTIDVDLPSTSTGSSTGTLALRIFAPATLASARYPEGAPVIIFANGGEGSGTLDQQLGRATDCIRIVFLYPGGNDLTSGRRSSGTYDYRGANSIAAMRDVVLYAAGLLTDNAGRTIDRRVAVPVIHNNIGIFGSSNGGNMVAAVAAQHGAPLSGYLRYVIHWESPVCSQIAVGDIAPPALDCGLGSAPQRLNAANPWYDYTRNTATELSVDYSRVRYDPTSTARPLFFDGSGDGRYTTIADPAHAGCQTPDLNGDGTLSTSEDRGLSSYAYSDGVKRVYSRQATQAFESLGLFSTWPATVATVSEANTFWDLREAVRMISTAATNISDLEAMFLVGLTDHIQTTAPEKPHAHQVFDNWVAAGKWVRINPARSYYTEIGSALSRRTDIPETAALTAPIWTTPASYAYPDDVEATAYAAGVHEMADRARLRSTSSTGDTTPPTVTVSAPNGGERIRRGTTTTITWTASDNVALSTQDVEVSTDGGANYASIVTGLSGSTSRYNWTIAADAVQGKKYRIRVVARDAAGNSGADASDANFKIK